MRMSGKVRNNRGIVGEFELTAEVSFATTLNLVDGEHLPLDVVRELLVRMAVALTNPEELDSIAKQVAELPPRLLLPKQPKKQLANPAKLNRIK
jgi:hypothetical protein